MGVDLTTFNSVLKVKYAPAIYDQMSKGTVLLTRVKKEIERMNQSGKSFTVPLRKSYSQGTGARAYNGTLPTAGANKYTDAVVPITYNFGRVKIYDAVIKASKNNEGAFVNAVDDELGGVLEAMRQDVNRQLHGDGSGLLGTVASVSGSGTLTVVVDSTWRLREGMLIDFYTGASPVTNGISIEIATIISATEFTCVCSGSPTTNDVIYRAGSKGLEMAGLGLIISASGTFQGIDRSADYMWQAPVLANSGIPRALTLALMQQAMSESGKRGGNISLIICDHTQRDKYVNLLVSDKRFVNSLKLDGGFEAVEYNGKPVVADAEAVAGEINFIDETTLMRCPLSEFEWMDEDGNILQKVSGEAAYEGVVCLYDNFAAKRCNTNVRLDDLDVA